MRLTASQIATALRALRGGAGLTASKAAEQPILSEAFGLSAPSDLVVFLRDHLVHEGQSLQARAARNALALGYAARANLTARREWFLADSHAFNMRTVARWEDEGFEELAHHLVGKQIESDAGSEGNQLEARVAELERENLRLRLKVADFVQIIGDLILHETDFEPDYRLAVERSFKGMAGNFRFLSEEDIREVSPTSEYNNRPRSFN